MEDLTHSVETSPIRKPVGGRYKNGRVKGMVQSFERSSSFDDGPPMFVRERSGSAYSSGGSGLEDEDEDISRRSTFRPARQLPIPPSLAPSHAMSPEEEEPTMEQLLASTPSIYPLSPPDVTAKEMRNGSIVASGQKNRRGVHAWEADDVGGVTVKRVASDTTSNAGNHIGLARGVSGIFEETLVSQKVDAEVSTMESVIEAKVGVSVATDDDGDAEEEEKLKEDLDFTRALLEQFRQRLVEIEQKIEDMEQRQEKNNAMPPRGLDSEPVPILGTAPLTLYNKVFGLLGSPRAPENSQVSPEEHPKRPSPYDRLLDPKTISALPSYLVLVSIGVCAVVFKVLLRRTLGVAVARKN